jgi:large repetitive protein
MISIEKQIIGVWDDCCCDLFGGFGSSQYDPNANVTYSQSRGLSGFYYDPFTQLPMRVSEDGQNEHVSFEYGGNKQRLLKIEQIGMSAVPNSTLYIHGLNDYPLTEKYNEQSTIDDRLYIYGPAGLIATIKNGITHFVLKDHLGSTRVLLNSSNGAVTCTIMRRLEILGVRR